MKKTLIITALVASLFLCTGCNFLRRIAGRPTSSELEARQALVEKLGTVPMLQEQAAAMQDEVQAKQSVTETPQQTAPAPAAKPAAASATTPAAKPAQQAAQPATKPASQSASQPASKPAQTTQATAAPVAKPVTASAQPAAKPVSSTSATRPAAGLTADKVRKVHVKQVGNTSANGLRPYYLVIGSFTSTENASNLAATAKARGYDATLLPARNGFTAVAVCAAATEQEVRSKIGKVLTEDFCPGDVWIIENE